MAQPDITGRDLAQWLQEAGRRRAACPAASPAPVAEPVTAAAAAAEPAPAKRASACTLRLPLLFAVAATAFLWYFYADVQLTIYKLQSLIVFVFAGK